MDQTVVKGLVSSGEGIGAHLLRIPWARKQIKEKLGFDPYPGTLNVCISTSDEATLKTVLKRLRGTEIIPENGFLRACCFEISINSETPGAVVIPQKVDYPPNIIEIISPMNLRETLQLTNGDEIEITFLSPIINQ